MRGLFVSAVLLFLSMAVSAQPTDRFAYIEKYKEIAIREMRRTGIPASIKLGQGILESAAGGSTLARRANNHFGIKCGSTWDGKKFFLEDDDYDDKGRLIESCFRAYRNGEASYTAHSEFLRDPRKAYRYGFLFRIDPLDYKAWARGLLLAGYATSRTYAQNLIRVIEQYQLYELDRMTMEEIEEGPLPGEGVIEGVPFIVLVNDVKMVFAREGETPAEIARRTRVDIRRIVKYNEKLESANAVLQDNDRIFLQKKRCNFRERQKWHYVKEEEDMYDISQLYGLRLKKLYKRNKIEPGQEPAVGERIRLRGRRNDPPQLRSQGPSTYFSARSPVEEMPMDEGHAIPNEVAQERILRELDLPELPEQPEEIPESEKPEKPNETEIPDKPVTPKPPKTEKDIPPPPPDTEPETQPEKPEQPQLEPDKQPVPQGPIYHEVVKGDTLYNISKRYDTTVDKLRELNDLNNNLIKIGQKIRVR